MTFHIQINKEQKELAGLNEDDLVAHKLNILVGLDWTAIGGKK